MAYRKPTLTETYSELRLTQGSLTEARFFELVPKVKEKGFTEIEFAAVGLSLEIKEGRPFPREQQRVRCWKPGRTQLVQVGEDLLVINLTGQYPGWDAFLSLFHQGREALSEGLPDVEVDSLSLVTIDKFLVEKDAFSASSHLNVGGPIIPGWYSNTPESLDINLGKGLLAVDGRNRQVNINVKAGSDPVSVTIRSQFVDKLPPGSDLNEVLERLHKESNATFESLITDRLRSEIMGGAKS